MSSPIEAPARRAVRRAGRLRGLSAAVAVAGAGLFALFLHQAGFFAALLPKTPPPPDTVTNPEQITGETGRIAGFDKDKQPFVITSARGEQDKELTDIVHLETVAGDFQRLSGSHLTVTANTARYDTKQKLLDLAGQVRIAEGTRFTALTEKANVRVDDKVLTSDAPVHIDTETGSIDAKGMTVTEDGNRILLTGGVKALLGQASSKGDGG